MSVKKLLQFIALSAIVRGHASEVTFKNVTLTTKLGDSTKIIEFNNLSEYLPKKPVIEAIVEGWIPVLYENSVSHVSNVERIAFQANGIEEIQPGAFKNFKGVKALKIIGSNLTVIQKGTFKDLPLEKLLLDDNTIEEIKPGAFANLPNLKELSLTGNRIDHLHGDVFDELSLEVLDLSNNFFSKIPEDLFNNLKVEEIYLQTGELTTIPGGIFSNNSNLKKISFWLNKISFVAPDAFDNMPNLEELYFNFNKLTKLDPKWFHNSPNINRLEFAVNLIEEIPNEAFKNIIQGSFAEINLSENRINRILPEAFEGVRRIGKLDLSINEIDKWDGNFLKNVEIGTLDVSTNKIRCLEGILDDVFTAYQTLLLSNPLDDKCVKKIDEWDRVQLPEGPKVSW